MSPWKLSFLGLVALACGAKSAETGARAAAPAPVVVAAVQVRDVPLRLFAVGAVEPFSTVTVRPQVSGVLLQAAFEEGQEVRKGDVLFRIDDRPFVAALHQAQATLARDEALSAAANRDAARFDQLDKQHFVSHQDLDRTSSQAASLKATVEADKAAVETARLSVEYCTIRSPIDGRTGAIQVRPGNVVLATPTPMTLVTIHQLRPIRATFTVPEARLPELRATMAAGAVEVLARPEGDPGAPIAGTLSFLGNEVDRTTGTFLLKAVFPNDDGRLWPSQFVRVSATLGVAKDAIVVPTGALQEGQKGTYVYVVKDDATAELRQVRSGATEDGWVVVETGLSRGEKVVVDGQVRVAPGAKVEAREAPADAGAAR
jgi:multidrug efflux system membrane fusion protein